ncbi:DNA cytosine methyltransferase [Ekhidna sp.]|uniref:DNA cytosine methyltransferase n=1 Tax=Ekhidna sp. TaxID=2608089 RepID=UPI003CCC2518
MNKRSLISLYSGGGGLDLGLENAGFRTLYANDLESLCQKTYDLNLPHTKFFSGSVIDFLDYLEIEKTKNPETFENIDLLAGGPPCPPFSKSRFYRKEMPRALDDPTAEITISSYFKALELLQPKAFIFENVAGITFKSHKDAFEFITSTAESLGYKISWKIINTADYGVPQIRQRFIMVGIKGKKFVFPEETHSKEGGLYKKKWLACGSVLNDLDTEENADDTGHFAGGKHHNLLKEVPPGDNYLYFTEKRGYSNPVFKWRSRYWSFLLKLDPNLPSWTIQARRSNNMGPFHWRNRILRIEEVKRIQTFPDSWQLAGTIEQQWRQVGNAVPPLFAEILGHELSRQMEKSTNNECLLESTENKIY